MQLSAVLGIGPLKFIHNKLWALQLVLSTLHTADRGRYETHEQHWKTPGVQCRMATEEPAAWANRKSSTQQTFFKFYSILLTAIIFAIKFTYSIWLKASNNMMKYSLYDEVKTNVCQGWHTMSLGYKYNNFYLIVHTHTQDFSAFLNFPSTNVHKHRFHVTR